MKRILLTMILSLIAFTRAMVVPHFELYVDENEREYYEKYSHSFDICYKDTIKFTQPTHVHFPQTLTVPMDATLYKPSPQNIATNGYLPFATTLITKPQHIRLSYHTNKQADCITLEQHKNRDTIIYDGPNNNGAYIIVQKYTQEGTRSYTFHIIATRLCSEQIFKSSNPEHIFDSTQHNGLIKTVALDNQTNTFCIQIQKKDLSLLKLGTFYSRRSAWIHNKKNYQSNMLYLVLKQKIKEPLKSIFFITAKLLIGLSESGSLYTIQVEPGVLSCTKRKIRDSADHYNGVLDFLDFDDFIIKTITYDIQSKQIFFLLDVKSFGIQNLLYTFESQQLLNNNADDIIICKRIGFLTDKADKLYAYNNTLYAQQSSLSKVMQWVRPYHILNTYIYNIKD